MKSFATTLVFHFWKYILSQMVVCLVTVTCSGQKAII